MGYVDQDGQYHYEQGHGSGVEGTRYNSETPQGQFGPMSSAQPSARFRGGLPYWTQGKDRREHVLLVFFERRANKSLKVPPGDLAARLEVVTAKLEASRQKEMGQIRERLESFGMNRRDFSRLKFLESSGEFTSWAKAVLTDYFFDAADFGGAGCQSWDAGQCAYMHGDVKKIFVKQLMRKVDEIGKELYPAPPQD